MKRKMRTLFALLLTVCLLGGALPFEASAAEFPDMPQGWSKAAMEAAVENDLLSGDGAGMLQPQGLLTRAQMATVLTKAFGAQTKADLSAYSDMAEDTWYKDFVAKAVHMGIFGGAGGRMYPENNITRQEVFVVLANALNLPAGTEETLAAFRDADQVSDWAVGAAAAMVDSGYIAGSNGCLLPQDNITREQFAQIMYNIFGTYARTAGTQTAAERSVIISAPDVTLKDVTVTGDVIIADGVGDGDVILDNVTVNGRLLVRGGGLNSIHIKNSSVHRLVVAKVDGNVRISTQDGTELNTLQVEDGLDNVVIHGSVDQLTVGQGAGVVLTDASVKTVEVSGSDAKISLTGKSTVTEMNVSSDAKNTVLSSDSGASIKTLTAQSDVTVSGSGKINSIAGSGSVTDSTGSQVRPSTPTQPGGTGGGGGGGHRHNYKTETERLEPSCTEDGSVTLACSCGKTKTDVLPAQHDFSGPWVYDGTQHWKVCLRDECGTPDTKADHNWGEGTVTDEPTCTEDGVRTFTCECGATKTETEAALDHNFTDAPWTVDDTQHWHVCIRCDVTDTKADHVWGDGVVTTQPTCAADGVRTFTCECGKTRTETEPSTGHNFTGAPWLYDEVQHWHTCLGCTVTDTKADHVWDEGVVTKQPNCTKTGVRTFTCECGATKTETEPALDHDFTDAPWKNNTTQHWHVCVRSGCNVTDTKINHSWDEGVVTKQPTCTKTGVRTFTCECGATKTETEPTIAHDFTDAPWKNNTTQHWHVCVRSGCNATDTKENHDWGEGVVTEQPTSTTTGTRTYTCVCGRTKTETIPVVTITTPVAAAKGILDMTQAGVYIKVTMVAPDDLTNIDNFRLYFYDSSDRAGSQFSGSCSKTDNTFYLNKDKFKAGYNYDTMEIVSRTSAPGCSEGVWSDQISITQTYKTVTITSAQYNTGSGVITLALDQPITGFCHRGIWSGDTLIENDSSYNSFDECTTLTHKLTDAERAVSTNSNTRVQIDGWNITQLEKVGDLWTIAFTKYESSKAAIDVTMPDPELLPTPTSVTFDTSTSGSVFPKLLLTLDEEESVYANLGHDYWIDCYFSNDNGSTWRAAAQFMPASNGLDTDFDFYVLDDGTYTKIKLVSRMRGEDHYTIDVRTDYISCNITINMEESNATAVVIQTEEGYDISISGLDTSSAFYYFRMADSPIFDHNFGVTHGSSDIASDGTAEDFMQLDRPDFYEDAVYFIAEFDPADGVVISSTTAATFSFKRNDWEPCFPES